MSVFPTPAGGLVPYGSTVTIRVSAGVPIIKMPDVTGQKLKDAQKKLEELGLKVEPTQIGGDHVVIQNPPPDTEVEQGTTVQLFLN
jgi:eukaryotic-like serine/threonine-protein kinase